MSELIVVLLSFILVFVLFVVSYYYIHEGGHMFFGMLSSLLVNGRFPHFIITSWMYIDGIPIPQQTTIIDGVISPIYILGGVLTVTLLALLLCRHLLKYKGINKIAVGSLTGVVILNEWISNYFCGTDNFTQNILPICKNNTSIDFLQKTLMFLIPIYVILVWVIVRNKSIETVKKRL
jgi:hypothetical protein